MPSNFHILKRAARRERYPSMFGHGDRWKFFTSAFGITAAALVAIYIVWTLVDVLASIMPGAQG